LARVDLVEARVGVAHDEVGDAAAHLALVEALLLLAHRDGDLGRVLAAPLADRHQQPQQVVLKGRGDAAHHAEIEQGEARVVGDEDVAGVRVGVEDAVHEYLLEVGAEQFVG
jgi:hypothetical protein